MEFIDTHTHTYDEAFDGCGDEVIARTVAAGVKHDAGGRHRLARKEAGCWP